MKPFLVLLLANFIFFNQGLSKPIGISRGYSPSAPVASFSDSSSLWYNPAGLGFLNGTFSQAQYQYEWLKEGNRHHATLNIGSKFFDFLTLAVGLNSRSTFAKENLQSNGSDITGIFGLALKAKQTSFGLSLNKYHNFLHQRTSSLRYAFGLQSRLNSYMAFGFSYEKIYWDFLSAPIITTGFSLRPLAKWLTLGLDGRFFPNGVVFKEGFRFDPIFNLGLELGGVNTGVSLEIPDIKSGWNKPIIGLLFELNFAHVNFGLIGHINSHEENFSIGGKIKSSTEKSPSIYDGPKTWVKLDIDSQGSLDTKPPASLFLALFGERPPHPLTILALLKQIKDDKKIAGVLLNFAGFGFGMGKAEEWRDIILSLKSANKKVIVYLNSPTERDYYIASAADRIYLNKNTVISLSIFRTNLIYLADTLKKIGIKAHSITSGNYKTAPRMFTDNKPRKEELEVYNDILSSFYIEIITKVAKERNINEETLKKWFDEGDITASFAKENGLVDEIIDKNEFITTAQKDFGEIKIFKGYVNQIIKDTKWQEPKTIYVIPIAGTIIEGRTFPKIIPLSGASVGSDDVIDEINFAKNDPDVSAIIIRIESPGGSAEAGSAIYEALMKAKEVKPIIASMGDIAASAGYLIASGCDYIFAPRQTITGSIGVFSLHFEGKELFEKIGANSFELKVTQNPGPNIFRGFTKKEEEHAQKGVNWYYDNFLNSVSRGLNLDKEYIKSQSDGRIWLGFEALDRKLVQSNGGLLDAIKKAKELSNLDELEEINLMVKIPSAGQNISLSRLIKEEEMSSLFHWSKPFIEALEVYKINGQPQARLPVILEWAKKP